ncbi:KPN_02809 family neutral zinc metallopeptidase [Sedimenticola sp.]|uniref:KPN_02809 family neutral zinc metallopeptidase n=1 Tax=Sedimenticola sp. TaxID=1940285 RepID=UPI003D0A7DDF
MRWRGNRQSDNIEDRRGMRATRSGNFGGGGGALRLLPVVIKFLGVKGTLIAVALFIGYGLFSGTLSQMLGGGGFQEQSARQTGGNVSQSAQEKELVQFISVVLADTEDTWHALFQEMGREYKEPRLVLYRQSINSGCGFGSAEMGPFYCPADQKVYLDLSFYEDLRNRYQAPGDFAQAYVVAHEIGHHVQTLTGISRKVQEAKQGMDSTQANQLSVRQELQADCFAGIWAHHADRSRQILEAGDVEEGLTAASAIGDDRLQKQSRGYVTPDSFTHGSSRQRVKWFGIGLKVGTLKACDTFSSKNL